MPRAGGAVPGGQPREQPSGTGAAHAAEEAAAGAKQVGARTGARGLEGLLGLRRGVGLSVAVGKGRDAKNATQAECPVSTHTLTCPVLPCQTVTPMSLPTARLASLESLSGLVGLVQLSVEDNELGGLAGVDRLTNLMELYAGERQGAGSSSSSNSSTSTSSGGALPCHASARVPGFPSYVQHGHACWPFDACDLPDGHKAASRCRLTNFVPPAGNNRISELREIQRLRELPKLIILDLAGNPLAGSLAAAAAAAAAGAAAAGAPGVPPPVVVDDYRLYVIFNVRKLKVRTRTATTWLKEARVHAFWLSPCRAGEAAQVTLAWSLTQWYHRLLCPASSASPTSRQLPPPGPSCQAILVCGHAATCRTL